MSTGAAIFTQQVGDRAIGRYSDLLDLDPSISKKLKLANVRKRGAFVSLMAVLGFTASNSHLLPVKMVGYLTLGTLGVAGHLYEKRINARIAKKLRSLNECNLLLSGVGD